MTAPSRLTVALVLIVVFGGGFAAGRLLDLPWDTQDSEAPAAISEVVPVTVPDTCELFGQMATIFAEYNTAYERSAVRHDSISGGTPAARAEERRTNLSTLAASLDRLADEAEGVRFEILVEHAKPLSADLEALAEVLDVLARTMRTENVFWTALATGLSVPSGQAPAPLDLRLAQEAYAGIDTALLEVRFDRCGL